MTTVAEFAQIVRVTEKTVLTWIKAGMPVQKHGSPGGGKKRDLTVIDLEAAVRWYFSTNHERLELDRARTRQADAQAEAQEWKNAELKKTLVRTDVVQALWNSWAQDMAAQLDSLPGRVANELAGLSDPSTIRRRLLEETRAIRANSAARIRKLSDSHGD